MTGLRRLKRYKVKQNERKACYNRVVHSLLIPRAFPRQTGMYANNIDGKVCLLTTNVHPSVGPNFMLIKLIPANFGSFGSNGGDGRILVGMVAGKTKPWVGAAVFDCVIDAVVNAASGSVNVRDMEVVAAEVNGKAVSVKNEYAELML